MSYTIVRDEAAELDRLSANMDNIIRRLFRKGVGAATIVALLRCSYRDVNEAVRG